MPLWDNLPVGPLSLKELVRFLEYINERYGSATVYVNPGHWDEFERVFLVSDNSIHQLWSLSIEWKREDVVERDTDEADRLINALEGDNWVKLVWMHDTVYVHLNGASSRVDDTVDIKSDIDIRTDSTVDVTYVDYTPHHESLNFDPVFEQLRNPVEDSLDTIEKINRKSKSMPFGSEPVYTLGKEHPIEFSASFNTSSNTSESDDE